MAAVIGGGLISGIGSIIGSGKQASAIKSAAKTQADSANRSADLAATATKNSLDYTKGVYADTKGTATPYQDAGTAALSQISSGEKAGGEFNTPYNASTILADDPGYQFRMDQGQEALDRASAAGGSVGSGGALKAAEQYGQNFASGEFGAAYARHKANMDDRFSQLSSTAAGGQTADAVVANAGTGSASNVSNTSLTGANTQGNDIMGAANATAAGKVGDAKVWAGNLSNIGTAVQQALAQTKSGYTGPVADNSTLPIAGSPAMSLPNLDSYMNVAGDSANANG